MNKICLLPDEYKVLIKTFFIQLILFLIFRMLFVARYFSEFAKIPFIDILKSFFIGARFDISLISYSLIPIFIVNSLPFIGIVKNRISKFIVLSYAIIINSIFTFMIIVNLEFFGEFNSHLNLTAIEYFGTSAPIMSMIWGHYPIIRYFLLFLVIIFSLIFILYRVYFRIKPKTCNIFIRIISFLILGGFLFLGIRGRANEGVMRWGTAFFSEYNIINQTAQNPIHHFIKDYYYSTKSKKKGIGKNVQYFADNNEAIRRIKNQFSLEKNEFLSDDFPMYKFTDFSNKISLEKRYNIVIILMETFSAELVGCMGNEHNLTPEFDKLVQNGILFDNFYSAGIRSNRSFASTICSFPPIPGKSMVLMVEAQQKIPSIASILKERGYSTHFIYGGDTEFDNMRGFFKSKGVDHCIGDKDFDKKFINKWGALDGDLFDKSLDVIDKYSEKPFFSIIYTLTNHEPFDLPNIDFDKINIPNIDEKLLRNYNTFKYTDRELGRFIREFRKKDYFDNTIFLIFGDHSKAYHHDLSFDYRKSHVPLLIYAPSILDSSGYINHKIVGQIDIAPTICSLLNLKTENSFFGHNIFASNKGSALIVNNSKFGFLQDDFYYSGKLGESGMLYKYKDFSGKDYSKQFPKIKKKLKEKAYSYLQSSYNLYKEKKIAE